MAASSSISISGTVEDLPGGSKTIGPITATSAAAVGDTTTLVLQSGANTITIPALATIAIVVFDSTSAVAKTIKGVTGDTGILCDPAGWMAFTFTAGLAANFVITAGATDTGLYTTIMFA